MKHLVLMTLLVVGFIAVQSQPVLANVDTGSIVMVQDDGGDAIVQDAVEAEAPAEIKVDGWWSKALNFILGIIGITFAAGWKKAKTKLRQLAELGLKLHQYLSDDHLDKTELLDIVRRIFEIIGKDAPKHVQIE